MVCSVKIWCPIFCPAVALPLNTRCVSHKDNQAVSTDSLGPHPLPRLRSWLWLVCLSGANKENYIMRIGLLIWFSTPNTTDSLCPCLSQASVTNRRKVANDGGGGGVDLGVHACCECLCGVVWVHLSLLPRPKRLALHLSSINHRERLLSHSVAIVSGPETVSGCL